MFGPPVALISPEGLPVERGKIHEFACAIYDDDPLYHDETAAKAAGLPSVVAPTTFTATHAFFSDPMAEMSELGDLDLNMMFVLHGGQEYEFERPIFAGEVLKANKGEMNVYTKQGRRGGLMKFVEITSNFTDEKGEVVMRLKSTLIQTSGVVEK
jgi:acyl dehydratase